jgi:hypothetical protein
MNPESSFVDFARIAREGDGMERIKELKKRVKERYDEREGTRNKRKIQTKIQRRRMRYMHIIRPDKKKPRKDGTRKV